MDIKNKTYRLFAFGAVMATLCLASCAGDEELSSSLDASKDKITSPADVAFNGNTNTATFDVQASGLWNIDGIPDWFTLDKVQGSGNSEVRITTKDTENPSALNERTAKLTIHTDTRQREITVVQSPAIEKLSVSTNEVSFPRTEESLESSFVVTNNSTWEILETQDWYTATPMSGNGSETVTIKVKKKEDDWDNEHTLTIQSAQGLTETVKIYQQGILTTLAIAQNKIDVDALEGITVLQLSGDASWIASVDAGWLKLGKLSGKGDENLQLTYSTNETSGPREATVTITTSTQELKCVVTQAIASVPTCAEPTMDKVEKYGFTVTSSYSSVIPVSEYGIVYSQSPNPTVGDSKIPCIDGTNPFTLSASSLVSGKTFYVRAYARNGAGIGYSDQIEVVTGGKTPGKDDNPTPNL